MLFFTNQKFDNIETSKAVILFNRLFAFKTRVDEVMMINKDRDVDDVDIS